MKTSSIAIASIFLNAGLGFAVPPALDLGSLVNSDEARMDQILDQTLTEAKVHVAEILKTNPKNVTFKESFGAYDQARMKVLESLHLIELVSLVSTDAHRREKAAQLSVVLRRQIREIFGEPLVSHLLDCSEYLLKKQIQTEERRLVEFVVSDIRRQGTGLSKEKRDQIKRLEEKIANLSSNFEKNIQDLHGTVKTDLNELEGVDPKLIAIFSSKGEYRVGTDYPSVDGVLDQAKSDALRRKVYSNFNNRAYPANYEVLSQLREERKQLAQVYGFPSYSHLDLSNEMSLSPENVRAFLDSLVPALRKRVGQEAAQLTQIASKEDHDPTGKFYPWAVPHLRYQYSKTEKGHDLAKVSEYFPLQESLDGLFLILKKQFGIRAEIDKNPTAWHADVKVVNIYFEGKYRGQIFLDLFPRDGKYTHGRVMILRPSSQIKRGKIVPGQAVILANLTKPAEGQTALFTFKALSTLFHEFGHALHSLLIDTRYSFMDSGEMAVSYGLPVKTDFVELPSQLLEFWLRDPKVLQNLSHHFQTGEHVSAEMARAIVSQDDSHKGMETMMLLARAVVALDLYSDQSTKSIDEIWNSAMEKYLFYRTVDPNSHIPASFIHLASYGSKYYSYLWTQVFAFEIFSEFKKAGLVDNEAIGKKYCHEVLGPGGSVHPSQLLRAFLGREMKTEGFAKYLGE